MPCSPNCPTSFNLSTTRRGRIGGYLARLSQRTRHQEWNTDDADLTDCADQRLLGCDPYHPSDPSDPCSILGSKTQPYRTAVSTAPKCPNLSDKLQLVVADSRGALRAREKRRQGAALQRLRPSRMSKLQATSFSLSLMPILRQVKAYRTWVSSRAR
jgi:hypothetical protein